MRSDAIRAEADMEDGMRAKDDGRHNGHAAAGQTRDRASTSSGPSSRAVLPIPDVSPPGLTTYDAKDRDTWFPPIEPLRPPEGAPNVLIVLLDDVGFGASSAFGGPCSTPTFERLAAEGLRYNRFGDVKWVKIELGSDMHDHRVDPQDAARVAMSLQ